MREALKDTANYWDAEPSFLSSVVYLGPPPSAKQLRTVIQLRIDELSSASLTISKDQKARLVARKRIEWSDLETPTEILERVAQDVNLKISNLSVIPHDLFRAAALPASSSIEAISLILIQFDLSFRWQDQAQSIELSPLPEKPVLVHRYRKSKKHVELIQQLKKVLPDLSVTERGDEIVLKGRIEEHEAFSSILDKGITPKTKPDAPLQPLAQRRFTFNSNQPVPIVSLIEKLEESGITIEYDRSQLKSAGVDLSQLVEVDVKNVPADEFFRAIFSTTKIKHRVERNRLILSPQP